MEMRGLTPNVAFQNLPELLHYFRIIDGKISSMKRDESKKEECERLKEKRRNLFDVAKRLDGDDLKLLFYLENLKGIDKCYVFKRAKRLYEEEQALITAMKTGEIKQE